MHVNIPFLDEDYIPSCHFAFPEQSSPEVGRARLITNGSIHNRLIYVKRNT
jgi:hypothetical protein